MLNANCSVRRCVSATQRWKSNLMTARNTRADDVARQFLGTWRLIAFSQNGQPHPVYGWAPRGTIRYEADGTMAVQIMPDDTRPCERSESAPAEAPAIPGYIAYFGRYSVDARTKTVAHDRVGNMASGESRTVVRHYEFLPGNRLALTLDEDPSAQVLWERAIPLEGF